MMLFPYDAYKTWKGVYPGETVQQLMAKLASRWSQGLELLTKNTAPNNKDAMLELSVARTCHTHFESTANQVEFYLLRDEAPTAAPDRQNAIRKRLIEIAERERELARQQFHAAKNESLIGYEASNHYYYTPIDLLEKMLQLRSGDRRELDRVPASAVTGWRMKQFRAALDRLWPFWRKPPLGNAGRAGRTRRRGLRYRFGPGGSRSRRSIRFPSVAASLPELLDLVDVVHVATPEDRHRDPVVAALQARKHVLLEKPFATLWRIARR